MEKPHKPLDAPNPAPPRNVGEEIEEQLDDAVENTFPASDPVAFLSQSGNPEEPPKNPLDPPRPRDNKQP